MVAGQIEFGIMRAVLNRTPDIPLLSGDVINPFKPPGVLSRGISETRPRESRRAKMKRKSTQLYPLSHQYELTPLNPIHFLLSQSIACSSTPLFCVSFFVPFSDHFHTLLLSSSDFLILLSFSAASPDLFWLSLAIPDPEMLFKNVGEGGLPQLH